MNQSTTAAQGEASIYVGLDVHKDSIDIPLAEAGREGEVRHHLGSMACGLDAVRGAASPGECRPASACGLYESGPCGFVL